MDVTLYYNDEAGIWQYSISSVKEPDNWIDSFETEESALTFCQENGMTVVAQYYQKKLDIEVVPERLYQSLEKIRQQRTIITCQN